MKSWKKWYLIIPEGLLSVGAYMLTSIILVLWLALIIYLFVSGINDIIDSHYLPAILKGMIFGALAGIAIYAKEEL